MLLVKTSFSLKECSFIEVYNSCFLRRFLTIFLAKVTHKFSVSERNKPGVWRDAYTIPSNKFHQSIGKHDVSFQRLIL